MKSRVAIGIVLIAAVIAAACDKVPLLAPQESTISVTSQALTLPPGGSTTITAMVMESSGTAVHNGTRVTFTATLGRVEPAEVETHGGTATTTFIAGEASGTAQIRATSGAATATGGTTGDGGTTTAGNTVQIAIGGAAAAAVTVSANPSRVGPSGGTVTIIASALDGSGNRLVGVPISFSTDVGTLSSSAALSDGTGESRVTLTTDRQATVTARAGNQSAQVVVAVATAGTVTLTTAPATPVSGSPITLTVTPAQGTSPRVVVDWGDGVTEALGIVAAARSATHTYQRAGSYTITAQSTADGETFSTAISIAIASSAAGLTLSDPSPTSPAVGTPVIFTVTPGTGTTPRVVIEWGDGNSTDLGTVTAARSVTHTYTETGTFIVTATASAAGDTFATSKPVTVGGLSTISVSVTDNRNGAPTTGQSVTFTATVTPTTVAISTYQWTIESDFPAEEATITNSNRQLSRTFQQAGIKTISVTVTTTDGRNASGTTQINVSAP